MPHKKKINTAILGGGIAGLGAFRRAAEIGMDALIFEARANPGGLLDNFTVDGFRFDHAVHLSFATEPQVREIFDKTPFFTHPSDSKCFERELWLKHPVQNNLFPLNVEDKVDLIKSFIARPELDANLNYELWLRHQYGDAISERYPIRYTKKYWDSEAKNLSTTWIGSRMRRAELEEILRGALTPDTPNHYYTKEMRYPKIGGYKSFIQPLINSANIVSGFRCTEIDPINKELAFQNGETYQYENLVSTLPLPELVAMSAHAPEEVRAAARTLKATSIDLVSVAFNKPLVNDLWFYIYDEDLLASRAYSPSVKSPDNAPHGCSSLQFEFYSRGTESKFQKQDLFNNTELALKRLGLAQKEDIIFMDHRHLKYGNVIFDVGMEEQRAVVYEWCKENGILTCGRFGKWDYLWSNQSFLSGYNVWDEQ